MAHPHVRAPRLGHLAWLALLPAACTPEAYHGTPPPFFLQPLPLEPKLRADGTLDRTSEPLAPDAAADSTAAIEVTLDRALRVSVQTHPRVLSLLETVVQARADHLTASLLPNPSFGASYTLAPFPGRRFNATSRQGGPPQLDLGITAMVDALLFGKRAAGMRTAELQVDAMLARYADAGRQLMLGTIDDYFAVLQNDALRALQDEEHRQLTQFVALIERQVELGSATRIELDRARTALALTHRRLVLAEAEHDNSLTRFRTWLVGVEGGDRAIPVAGIDAATALGDAAFESLLQQATDNRPDLAAARREVTLAEATLARECARAWPWLSLSPGFTRQYQNKAIGFPDANSWGFGFDMSLPLFDRNQGNIAAAESMVRQAQLDLETTLVTVRAELAQALRDFVAARASAAIVDQTALQAAERARTGIEAAHALGSRTLLEVLDARAAYREVQREQVRARVELQRTGSRLQAIVSLPPQP